MEIIKKYEISNSGLRKNPINTTWGESVNIRTTYGIQDLKIFEDSIVVVEAKLIFELHYYKFMTHYFYGRLAHIAFKDASGIIKNNPLSDEALEIFTQIYIDERKVATPDFIRLLNEDISKQDSSDLVDAFNEDGQNYTTSDEVRAVVKESVTQFIKGRINE